MRIGGLNSHLKKDMVVTCCHIGTSSRLKDGKYLCPTTNYTMHPFGKMELKHETTRETLGTKTEITGANKTSPNPAPFPYPPKHQTTTWMLFYHLKICSPRFQKPGTWQNKFTTKHHIKGFTPKILPSKSSKLRCSPSPRHAMVRTVQFSRPQTDSACVTAMADRASDQAPAPLAARQTRAEQRTMTLPSNSMRLTFLGRKFWLKTAGPKIEPVVSLLLCFFVSLFLCFFVSLFLCFFVSLFLCFFVSLFLCFFVWLVGWLVVWLVGWLVGLLLLLLFFLVPVLDKSSTRGTRRTIGPPPGPQRTRRCCRQWLSGHEPRTWVSTFGLFGWSLFGSWWNQCGES